MPRLARLDHSFLPLLCFPAEVVQSIIAWLPIDGDGLVNLARTCTQLARLVLNNIKFARLHFKKQLSLSDGSCLWMYLDSAGLFVEGWRALPLTYKAVILSELIVEDYADELLQDDDTKTYGVPESITRLMDAERWRLDEVELLQIMDMMNENPGNFRLATHGGCLLEWCCIYGHDAAVKKLLEDVDPMYRNGNAAFHAAQRGHVRVVEIFLACPRMDPDVAEGTLLLNAVHGNQEGILRILLADSRVDPARRESLCLIFALSLGHIEIAKLLMEDSRVDVTARDNLAVIISAEKGHTEILELLLKRDGVDPCTGNNAAIRIASGYEFEDAVKLLLLDGRVYSHYCAEWDNMEDEPGHLLVKRLIEEMGP
ncbi:ankyrin repeat-containing domain protein [Chytriomyces sp. MP71]|nr:ankyrin repeat-containing domain protein [Chytriomyces sp. MP71]